MANNFAVPSEFQGYKFEKKLGEGCFGQVWKARKGSEDFAIKVINKQANVENEVRALKSCVHPNIVQYKDLLSDFRQYYIVMEYCPEGGLSSYLNNWTIPEYVAQKIFQQLASAMNYVWHNKGIIHRDLKTTNILLASRNPITIKVADFGIAKILCSNVGTDKAADLIMQNAAPFLGTAIGYDFGQSYPLYMAPEVKMNQKSYCQQSEYSAKVDIWSIGSILYECLFGKKALQTLMKNLWLHKRSIGDGDIGGNVSDDCRDLLKKLLVYNPDNRIGYQALMAHPSVMNAPAGGCGLM